MGDSCSDNGAGQNRGWVFGAFIKINGSKRNTLMKPFNWRIFWILLAASVVGIVAIFPYALEMQSATLAQKPTPMGLPLLIALQIVQNTVMFAVAIILGLLAANRAGLGLPIIEAGLKGEEIRGKVKAIILPSVIVGLAGSVVIVLIDVYGFSPLLMNELGDKAKALNLQAAQPAAWKGLLASFYGGLNEEILLRLFVMSGLAWLGKFISRTPEGLPTTAVFWIANILAAVLFGLGHLPATAGLVPLTPIVITRAVVLNGLVGVGAGYLYKRYGLESAMLCHFSADIVLHVVLVV